MNGGPRVSPATTRVSLVARLGARSDTEAWSLFAEVYSPWIYGFLRRNGCQHEDAADLTQEVLGAVSGSIGKLAYDRGRGTFRGWLLTITRNKLIRSRSKRRPHDDALPIAEEMLADLAAGPIEAEWEEQEKRRLMEWACDRVRHRFKGPTWRAFHLTALEQKSPADVAAELGISVGAVYIARSRVIRALREEVEKVRLDPSAAEGPTDRNSPP